VSRRSGARVTSTLALAAFALGCASASSTAPPLWTRPGFEGAVRPEMGPPQPGDVAPDFELPITGTSEKLQLAALRGHWVVVHFTTTWCPFCDEEVEHLDQLAADYAARNVRALLIDVLEDPAHWQSYLQGRLPQDKAVPLSDVDGAVARRYAPKNFAHAFTERAHVVLASTLIVDPEGKIQLFLIPDSARFDPTLAAVRTRLDELLGSAPAASQPTAAAAASSGAREDTRTAEQVLSVAVSDPPALAPGQHGELQVTLEIVPGYHVMANPPSKPSYIPTTVQPQANGARFGDARFPAFTRFQLWDDTIDTLQGHAVVTVPFELDPNTPPGELTGTCKVEYQACNATSCLFPFAKTATFHVHVAN
jgi:peroxiredoxin